MTRKSKPKAGELIDVLHVCGHITYDVRFDDRESRRQTRRLAKQPCLVCLPTVSVSHSCGHMVAWPRTLGTNRETIAALGLLPCAECKQRAIVRLAVGQRRAAS